jgi:ATP phosphoribosyltransferase
MGSDALGPDFLSPRFFPACSRSAKWLEGAGGRVCLGPMPDAVPLLMLGLPKGSLEESTKNLFAKAGWKIATSSRSYRPSIDDPELDGRFVRAQEVSRYVEHGFFDCGLTGQDWIQENNSDVVDVCDLIYSKVSTVKSRWVLCVPESSPVKSARDLAGKRVATELMNTTRRYFEKLGVKVDVEFSWGATEVKVPDLVDAIVDITETGSSLRANKLRIVDTLLETNTKLIANKKSWANPAKRKKIETIALLLRGALEAGSKVGLKMNLPKSALEAVVKSLPALRNPTISQLSSPDWIALETIIDESVVREIIPQLKALGAEGIVEYPLNKVVY